MQTDISRRGFIKGLMGATAAIAVGAPLLGSTNSAGAGVVDGVSAAQLNFGVEMAKKDQRMFWDKYLALNPFAKEIGISENSIIQIIK